MIGAVRESEVQGRAVLFARAHCEDLRTFDADRVGEAEGFRIEASGVQNCWRSIRGGADRRSRAVG